MKHAIADILFTDEESSLICSCGWDVSVADEDDLNDVFQAHREEEGNRRRTLSDGVGDDRNNEFQRRQRTGHATSLKESIALRGAA